jgi:hypothetical protein
VGFAVKMDKVLELLGKESKGASLGAVKKALDG